MRNMSHMPPHFVALSLPTSTWYIRILLYQKRYAMKLINIKLQTIATAILLATTLNGFAQQQKTASSKSKSQSGYAPVNGLKMYYEIQGTGKPIVLLHGSFMTINMNWNKIMPMLAKNRKVIAVEMQGHGHTADIDRPITYEQMADDVSALLKYLKIDSADILGYSFGACVAVQMGIRHPEQVRKLVVVSGVYKLHGWMPEAVALFPSINAEMFRGTPIETEYKRVAPDTAHFATFIAKTIAVDTIDFDWGDENIRNIKAPMFIVIGDADGVVHEHALQMYKLKGGGKMGDLSGIPDSRLAILPATTHVGIMERTDWLIPMVNEFLDAAPQKPVQH